MNNPITLNEKIQWLKLHDVTEDKVRLSDKYIAHSILEQKVGAEHLPKILLATRKHIRNRIKYWPYIDFAYDFLEFQYKLENFQYIIEEYWGFDFKKTLAWIAADLPFDVIHMVGNVVFGTMVYLFSKLLRRLGREEFT